MYRVQNFFSGQNGYENCNRLAGQNKRTHPALDSVIIPLSFACQFKNPLPMFSKCAQNSGSPQQASCARQRDSNPCKTSIVLGKLIFHRNCSSGTMILWTIVSLRENRDFQFFDKPGTLSQVFGQCQSIRGFAFSTVRPSGTACAVRGRFIVHSRLQFVRRSTEIANSLCPTLFRVFHPTKYIKKLLQVFNLKAMTLNHKFHTDCQAESVSTQRSTDTLTNPSVWPVSVPSRCVPFASKVGTWKFHSPNNSWATNRES